MGLVQREIQKVYMWKEPYTDYSAMQGPCPDGFHVPSKDEWTNLRNLGGTRWSSGSAFMRYFKLPLGGYRQYSSGSVSSYGTQGRYWSCTTNTNDTVWQFSVSTSSAGIGQSYNKSEGESIRPFKDIPVIPDSSWTVLYQGTGSAGIYHNATLGLISASSDGSTWLTIADKNLGATSRWDYNQSYSDANCGYFFQWGNNYGFPHSGTVTTSSTQVNASSYGPGNFYNSSTFIIRTSSPYSWDSSNNNNLWGYITGPATGGGDIQIRPGLISVAGIYHNATLGLISLSSDGSTWITIADKNLGATSTDTSSSDSYGLYYCWGAKTPFTSSTANPNEEDWEQVQTISPSGYHIPTKTEADNIYAALQAILGTSNITNSDAERYLLLPLMGYKSGANILNVGTQSRYHTSTKSGTSSYTFYQYSSGYFVIGTGGNSIGRGVRFIKNSSVQPDTSRTKLY